MKEKKLLTYFFLTQAFDAMITAVALGFAGMKELGPIGAKAVESGQFESSVIVKLAVTALFIGFYALAKKNESKLAFSFEKAMQIAVVLMMLVLLWNTVNVGAEALLAHR